jgi:hypothetical protein
MANPRRSNTAPSGLSAPPAPLPPLWRRRGPLLIAAAVLGLIVLAYFDGGEQALRPIAVPVALPEQGQ